MMSSLWRRSFKPVIAALARLVPEATFKQVYTLAKLGYWPDLRRPRTFTELQLHRALRQKDLELGKTSDKYTVRAFIEERLGPSYLPPMVEVLEAGDPIDLAKWPPRVVMKATHASGWNRFVERDRADPAELEALVRRWTSTSYSALRGEWQYGVVTPRVIVEEDMSREGQPPADYKMFVFEGHPRLVVVDQDRYGQHSRFVVDEAWRPITVRYDYPPPEQDVPRPEQLPQLLEVGARLGEGFSFVRVDTYLVDGRILVGELTHFPNAGVPRFTPRAFDAELGAMWREGRPVGPGWLRDSGGGSEVQEAAGEVP